MDIMEEEKDEETFNTRYRTQMGEIGQVDTASFYGGGELFHACSQIVDSVVDPRAPKSKRIMKEFQGLQV